MLPLQKIPIADSYFAGNEWIEKKTKALIDPLSN